MLGVTMGMNTSVVALFNGYATRGWAAPDPSELVSLFRAPLNVATGPLAAGGFSLAEVRYLTEHSRS